MTQRWVLYGDGLLVSPSGFGETLLDHLLLVSPQATWQASIQGSEEMTLALAQQEASWRVIGKAPHGVVLAFGAKEIESGAQAKSLLAHLDEILTLIAAKTHAQIHLVSLPLAFFAEGTTRMEGELYNRGLQARSLGNWTYCDVNPDVDAFLAQHRNSLGEKRALHLQASKPTQLGRLLLAQSVAKSWPWPLF
jgi:hypothetical protein